MDASYFCFNLYLDSNLQNSLEEKLKKIDYLNNNILGNDNNYFYSNFNYNSDSEINLEKKLDLRVHKNKLIKAKIYIKKINNNNTNNVLKYECPICYENIEYFNINKLKCNHDICITCYKNWYKSCKINEVEFKCPLCRNIC